MHSYETLTAHLPLTTLIISTHRLTSITPPTMNITNNNSNNATSPHSLTSTTPHTMLHLPHPFPFTTMLHNPHTINTPMHMRPLRTTTSPHSLTSITPPTMNITNNNSKNTTNTFITMLHNPHSTSPLMNLPNQNFPLCLSLLENQRLMYITMHLNKHPPLNL